MYNISIDFNFDIELNLVDYKKLKNKSGIYFLYDWEGNIAYIGKSIRVQRRVYDHMVNADSNIHDYRFLLHSVKALYTESNLDTEILETYLINKFQPYLNIDYKTYQNKIEINTDELLEKSLTYKTIWEEAVQQQVKKMSYGKDEKINSFILLIKEKLKYVNEITPNDVSDSFNNYIKKHWYEQKELIMNEFLLQGITIYIDKSDKRNTKKIKINNT